ncbi:MAG: DUF1553 domain-containing protein [Opitutaceae bacterium]|nr:DUF1553 domain-containing protein [Opitutaceae bacterium]
MSVRIALLSTFGALSTAAGVAAPVNYLHDVKPVLTQHCVRCHGESKQEAGLRLDTAARIEEGGGSGPVVIPGRSARSMLFQVVTGTHDDIPQMPYKKPPLSEGQIAAIKRWIDDGASAPASEEPGKFVHWSFVAPQRPAPPAVKRTDWPKNAIDHFILARLEIEKIAPAPEADRVTLLRRVTLDLIGLPPTPAEVAAFLNDRSADAYERVVDRLLASPHYGERWARPWLDVARYADSNGYSIDAPRQIWKYRDWVVAALNRDLPYDEFVIQQLAGDLLGLTTDDGGQTADTSGQKPEERRTDAAIQNAPGTQNLKPKTTNPTRNAKPETRNLEHLIATGFNRNTQINQEGGIDPEQFRIESVLDRVNTFGTAFLGLTVGCAQCHDHKFDPIAQREYYQLFAFFNNTVNDGHGKSTPGGLLEFAGEFPAQESRQQELEETRDDLERYLNTQGSAVGTWVASLGDEERAKLKSAVRAALKNPWDKQTLAQKRAVYAAFRSDDEEFRTRNTRLAELERAPKAVSTLIMSELPEPRESFLFIKGDFTRPGEKVAPGTPVVLPPLKAGKPNRLDLARWVVNPANPLPARVIANRIWQQYFGRGIVETENDFGTQGLPPSHPELLDWLATEMIAQKWSWKAMHRLIVTSATYRQSSRVRTDLEVLDPTNKLLARQSRLRLDAEVVRDVALTASGLLVPKLGGPPVFPPQPAGVMTLGQVKRTWKPSTGPDRYRRGLYTHFWRATPHPALAVFDAADGFSACTRRLRSNTPLQALTLLNDEQFFEFAAALGRKIEREAPGDAGQKIDFGFQLCVVRKPTAVERERLVEFFRELTAGGGSDEPARVSDAWMTIARVLLNLDETITRE